MKSLTDKVDYQIWDKVWPQVYGGRGGRQIVMKVDLRIRQNVRDQVWQVWLQFWEIRRTTHQ